MTTSDKHRSDVNKNHGSCLAVLVQLEHLDIPEYIKTAAKEALDDHDRIIYDFRCMCSDDLVDQSSWRGDHCGYLAQQYKNRVARNLTPTDDQLEAWLHENTNEAILSTGEI